MNSDLVQRATTAQNSAENVEREADQTVIENSVHSPNTRSESKANKPTEPEDTMEARKDAEETQKGCALIPYAYLTSSEFVI